MDDLIEIIPQTQPPTIPEDWDFEIENKTFDELIFGWRRMTVDVVSVLWIFYNKLKRQGQRNDLTQFCVKLPSWFEWLELKGIAPNTPINHFRKLGWLPSNILALKHTGNQEYYTPAIVIDRVRQVLGEIDLDPASCDFAQKTIQAKKYYTVDDNGLEQDWTGKIFLNPPYSMPEIELFTDKLLKSTFKSAILLTNNNTDTNWFYKCAIKAAAICFTKGRINFYTVDIEKTQPTNGQAFFYFGKDINKFCKIFSEAGLIMRIL